MVVATNGSTLRLSIQDSPQILRYQMVVGFKADLDSFDVESDGALFW